jgi:hypothetical protein
VLFYNLRLWYSSEREPSGLLHSWSFRHNPFADTNGSSILLDRFCFWGSTAECCVEQCFIFTQGATYKHSWRDLDNWHNMFQRINQLLIIGIDTAEFGTRLFLEVTTIQFDQMRPYSFTWSALANNPAYGRYKSKSLEASFINQLSSYFCLFFLFPYLNQLSMLILLSSSVT